MLKLTIESIFNRRQNGYGQSESRGAWGEHDDRGGQRQGFGGGRGRSDDGDSIKFNIQKRDVGKIIGKCEENMIYQGSH